MTPQQREEYENLTPQGRTGYDLYRRWYPSWSHTQIMKEVANLPAEKKRMTADRRVENARRAKERQEYLSLSEEGRHIYDRYKASRPDLDHARWFTYADLLSNCADSDFGDADTKTIMTETLNKTGEHLKTNFPEIFARVKDTLVSIGNAIKRAVTVTWDLLSNLF